MSEENGNGRVTMAVLKVEVGHVKEDLNELKSEFKEVRTFIEKREQQLSDNIKDNATKIEVNSGEFKSFKSWFFRIASAIGIVFGGLVGYLKFF